MNGRPPRLYRTILSWSFPRHAHPTSHLLYDGVTKLWSTIGMHVWNREPIIWTAVASARCRDRGRCDRPSPAARPRPQPPCRSAPRLTGRPAGGDARSACRGAPGEATRPPYRYRVGAVRRPHGTACVAVAGARLRDVPRRSVGISARGFGPGHGDHPRARHRRRTRASAIVTVRPRPSPCSGVPVTPRPMSRDSWRRRPPGRRSASSPAATRSARRSPPKAGDRLIGQPGTILDAGTAVTRLATDGSRRGWRRRRGSHRRSATAAGTTAHTSIPRPCMPTTSSRTIVRWPRRASSTPGSWSGVASRDAPAGTVLLRLRPRADLPRRRSGRASRRAREPAGRRHP